MKKLNNEAVMERLTEEEDLGDAVLGGQNSVSQALSCAGAIALKD